MRELVRSSGTTLAFWPPPSEDEPPLAPTFFLYSSIDRRNRADPSLASDDASLSATGRTASRLSGRIAPHGANGKGGTSGVRFHSAPAYGCSSLGAHANSSAVAPGSNEIGACSKKRLQVRLHDALHTADPSVFREVVNWAFALAQIIPERFGNHIHPDRSLGRLRRPAGRADVGRLQIGRSPTGRIRTRRAAGLEWHRRDAGTPLPGHNRRASPVLR